MYAFSAGRGEDQLRYVTFSLLADPHILQSGDDDTSKSLYCPCR